MVLHRQVFWGVKYFFNGVNIFFMGIKKEQQSENCPFQKNRKLFSRKWTSRPKIEAHQKSPLAFPGPRQGPTTLLQRWRETAETLPSPFFTIFKTLRSVWSLSCSAARLLVAAIAAPAPAPSYTEVTNRSPPPLLSLFLARPRAPAVERAAGSPPAVGTGAAGIRGVFGIRFEAAPQVKVVEMGERACIVRVRIIIEHLENKTALPWSNRKRYLSFSLFLTWVWGCRSND
jgi:hypothetical protein